MVTSIVCGGAEGIKNNLSLKMSRKTKYESNHPIKNQVRNPGSIFRGKKLTLEITAFLMATAGIGLVELRNYNSRQSVNHPPISLPSPVPKDSASYIPNTVAQPQDLEAKSDTSKFKFSISRGIPYNPDSLPPITLFELSGNYRPSSQEQQFDLKQIIDQSPEWKGNLEQLLKESKTFWYKPEPDIAYSKNFIAQAERGIKHFFNFIRSSQIKIPKFEFIQIQKDEKIDYLNENTDGRVKFYLVSAMGVTQTMTFSAKYLYSSVDLTRTLRISGQAPLKYDTIKEFKERYTRAPIFISTTDIGLDIVETPALEVFHKVLAPYTLANINREYNLNMTPEDTAQLINKHTTMEEKLVHAIGILWLGRYSHDGNFDISNEELQQHFLKKEQVFKYNGVNKFSKYIADIGIRKAISMYRLNPQELFRGIN